MTGTPQWTTRLSVTSKVVHVVAYVVAVAGVMIGEGLTEATALATLLAAIGVLLAVIVPVPLPARPAWAVAAIITSVALFCGATGLTGGLSSAFVVMPIASIFLAAIAGGVRVAAPVAAIAIGGVMISGWFADEPVTIEAVIRVPAIYVIAAIAFSEVQRALLRESARAADILDASEAAQLRRERIEETHELLEDLLAVATSPDVNAVAAARDALRDIGVVLPDAPSKLVGRGNVHLARRHDAPDHPPSHSFAVERNDVELARLDVWLDDDELTPSQRAVITSSVEPVALALENDAMVQRVAGLTIQRERVRLARELHDDIAPSIASVGLALDMVLLGGGLSSDQERTLEATRTNVTGLVERIRDRVQDFRADRTVSIVELAHSLVAGVDADGPTVVVDIDERVPPRPAIAVEVGALITEAFRNAIRHADATLVTITGRIDERAGTITIRDDGRGFDPASVDETRYGLVGMTERAGLVGAELNVHSAPGEGTTITMDWEDS